MGVDQTWPIANGTFCACCQTRLSQENHRSAGESPEEMAKKMGVSRHGFFLTFSENPKWVNDQILVFNDHLQLHGTLGVVRSHPKIMAGSWLIPSIIISLLLKGFLQTSLFSSTNQWEKVFSSTNQWEKDIYLTNLRSNAKKTTESFLWFVDDRMTNN